MFDTVRQRPDAGSLGWLRGDVKLRWYAWTVTSISSMQLAGQAWLLMKPCDYQILPTWA